jgi:hypothetical protein
MDTIVSIFKITGDLRSIRRNSPAPQRAFSVKEQNIMKLKIASVILAAGMFATSFTAQAGGPNVPPPNNPEATSQQPSEDQKEYHKKKAYMHGEYSPTREEFIAWNQQAEYALNQTWSQLSPRQRALLRYEERKWIIYKDSLALEKRLIEIENRDTYLQDYLQQ